MTSIAHGFAFTTAVAAQNDLATKTIEMTAGGLVKSPYPNVSRWMFNRRQVADLGEMSHELAVLSDFPSIMIVRGEPLSHIDLGKPQLRRSNNSKPETNTLKDVPRSGQRPRADHIHAANGGQDRRRGTQDVAS